MITKNCFNNSARLGAHTPARKAVQRDMIVSSVGKGKPLIAEKWARRANALESQTLTPINSGRGGGAFAPAFFRYDGFFRRVSEEAGAQLRPAIRSM
ncbi:MAG TPA: hypothetical protein VF553_18870 [Pyrinomonadaceae bacterium]|jgi:hypothetical protein